MRRRGWAILIGCLWLAAFVAGGCGSSGGALPYDPGGGGSDPRRYALPEDFSQEQGRRGWQYLQAEAGTQAYHTLAWGPSPQGTPYTALAECWRDGAAPAALIGRTILHPGTGACAVLGWRVPFAGQVQVSVTLQSLVSDEDGDGCTVSIRQNTQYIAQPTLLPNNAGQSQTVTAQRGMREGDMLYIILDPLQRAAGDWYGYQVTITMP